MSQASIYRDIRYSVDGHMAHIELHRPRSLNSWTPDMGREILDAVRRANEDTGVRSVLVTGAGRAFCAGADVKVPRELTAEGVPDLASRLRNIYNPIVLAIRGSSKPFIAGIHGASAGLGVSLALSCDFVVAASDAYLVLAFVGIAVMPDGGATAMLSERVGLARAAELCMLGQPLTAELARQWGLVNEIYPASAVRREAIALARRLAELDPDRVALAKRLLTSSVHDDLADHLELEASLQQRHGATRDYEEGRSAFKEKRRPNFSGS